MQFIVNGVMVSAADNTQLGVDNSVIPAALRPVPLVKLTNFAGVTNVTPAVKRQLTLNEVMGMGGPLEVLVNNTKWDGNDTVPGLGETELPVEGSTEVWQIINLTADAHPIHLHLVQFQLVSRQKFNLNKYNTAYNASFPGGTVDGVLYPAGVFMPAYGPPLKYDAVNPDVAVGGNPALTGFLQGPAKPALPNERGWKDTYVVYPGEVTTFIIRYAPTDLPTNTPAADLIFGFDPSEGPGYVWHCHIIDHEDNEMMRPYKVVASPSRAALTQGVLKSATIKTASVSGTTTGTTNLKSADILSGPNKGISLDQNFPNPVTGETEIHFYLPEDAHVQLSLYNSLGQKVKDLIDANAPAGTNIARFNTESLKEGMYYYRLISGSFSNTKTMVVSR
jgi:hypothetical protein